MSLAYTPVAKAVALLAVLGGAIAFHPVAAAPKGKVDVCHRTGNGGINLINVSANAVKAHLGHGDSLFLTEDGVPGCVPAVQSWDYQYPGVLDVTAQDPGAPGTMYAGTGIPASGFGLARNEADGVELGLQVIYRQGPTVATVDNYGDGKLSFTVASGPQSTANGSSANHAGRAAWSFEYSIAAGLNGAASTLTNRTYQLFYDVDPGPGVTFRTLVLEAGAGVPGSGQRNGFGWRETQTNLVVVADDEGTASVSQNSRNYAFGEFQGFLTAPYGPGNSFAGPGTFDIVLQALDGNIVVARNHIVVNVSAP